MLLLLATLGLVAAVSTLSAQTGIAIVSSDHRVTSLLRTAPGQVTSIRLTGIPALPDGSTQVRPTFLPAPDVLAGISVLIGRPGPGGIEVPMRPMPILAVEQLSLCQGRAQPECLSTVVTAQVPFDVVPDEEPATRPVGLAVAALVVRYRGTSGPAFRIAIRQDNVHLLQGCNLVGERDRPCQAIVTDGVGARIRSWTTPEFAYPPVRREGGKAATPGEPLILYAFGLGVTTPTIAAGSVAPAELIRASIGVTLTFDYLTETGWTPAPGGPVQPQFTGLAPGSVGLYQVNALVPAPPKELRSCGGSISYNAVVKVFGQLTSDEALICVAPGE